MGLLDILNRHTQQAREDAYVPAYTGNSILDRILDQHEDAAQVQASYEWQTRRPNVGLDPGTHPVLLQAAAEMAREEAEAKSREQIDRFGAVSSLPSSQAYAGRSYLTNPGVSYLDYKVQQKKAAEKQNKTQVPYRSSNAYTDTMSTWLYKLDPKNEDKGTKITDLTSTMSPYLGNYSSEYAKSGQPIVSADNVKRISKLQNEISDLQKELDSLPAKRAIGPRGAVVTTDLNQKRRDEISREIGLKQQKIELLRREEPKTGNGLASTSSAYVNRMMQEESRKAEEARIEREKREAQNAERRRQIEEQAERDRKKADEDRFLKEAYIASQSTGETTHGGGASFDPEIVQTARDILESRKKEEEEREKRQATLKMWGADNLWTAGNMPSAMAAFAPDEVKAAYSTSRMLRNPEMEHDSKLIANISLSRASLDKNRAWSAYMHNPTEGNRKYAESMTRAYERHVEADKDIINRDDDIGNLVTEHIALYLPQAYDQLHYQLPGAVFGALLGGETGMKAGLVVGNTIYSYETMSGAAFENLIKQGVTEDVARQAAMDEAILSTIIEDIELIIDMFTTGFGKMTSSLFGTTVGGLDKAIADWVGDSTLKKWAVRFAKYGLNIVSEANEEGTQEAISIANERLRNQGKNISLTELAVTALNVYIDGLFNEDSENRDRILEAAKGGAALALINAPLESVGNAAIYGGTTLAEGRQIRNNNMINETVDAGLYNDPSSRAYQLAQRIQQSQGTTGGNRLQEIARQMQQDYRVGQLSQENQRNASAMSEAEQLVYRLSEKAGSGERITNAEVSEVLGNDLAVMELEQASGQEISTLGTRPERVEAVREALNVASENYRAASQLDQAEQSNIFSTTNRSLANGANSGSEGTLNTANATYITSQTPTGQRITGEFSTPALNEISASMTKRFSEERSRVLETRAREMQEDARARSVAAMNDRIDRVVQASQEEWERTLDARDKSTNFEEYPQLDRAGQEMFMREDGTGIGGYITYVADYVPGQDETRYTQEWTRYYNAGANGTAITDVGDITTQIITQEQREHAYEAGRWDGREVELKEITNEIEQQNIIGDTGPGGRTERIAAPSAGVEGGRGSIWSEDAARRRNLQREYAARARNVAAAEGRNPVKPSSLGIKGVSDKNSITEITEDSAAYTEGMRRLAERAKKFGTDLHFYIGTMIAADGQTEVRGSNEGRRVWVQADHEYLDPETIARHEEFHTVKRYYPRIMDMVRRKIISDHSEADLQEFMRVYAKAYGMTGMSAAEILEEVYADAYAGLDDFFEVQSAGYEGATRFTDTVREATQEYENRVQEDVAEGLSEEEVREREGNQELAEEDRAEEAGTKFSRMVEPYSQHEINNFTKSKKIEIYNGDRNQIKQFADRALTDSQFVKKLYFGKVSKDLAADILKETGHDFSGLNVALNADNIRKIKKDHGNQTEEVKRGQRAVVSSDYMIIPDILENYDRIIASWYNSGQGVKPAVEFYLTNGNERNVLVFVKSGNSRLDMYLQTMYINKKGGIANVPTAQAMSITSGTLAGTTSKNNITQPSGIVNNETNLSQNTVDDINETKEDNEITRKVENGEGLTPTEEVRFSLNHDADFIEKERAFKQSFVSNDVLTESFAQRESVRNKLMQPGIRELLPEDKMGKTSFGNGSYGRSMEHSTICPRTLSMEAILDGLSEKFGRPITVDESIKISQLAWAYMDAPECAYCYVAMDRKAKREYLLNYMTSRNEVFKNIDSGMSREDAYNAFLNGRKDTKPMRDRFNNWIRMRENGSEMIEMKDLASDRAIKAASQKSKSMADQVKDALKYAQSASWAKKYVQYTAYNGEILKWNQKLVNALNRMYGMRMYSFSDFHPAFTLEDMQMVTDASLRGLKVLAYTKELDFARIMEPTGANINISVFAQNKKDVNGNYGMDAMQGADWEEAKALRAKSIKNGTGIGITIVCTSDEQVEWALAQDWIDVVIPFHMVKTGDVVRKAFGWNNYTDMQSDKKLKDLWDGKINEAMIEPPEHQNNKQLYLEALKRNNLSPRFEKWVDNPNYMKLVNETRRAEGDTPTVQPKFNLDAADAMFDKMQKQGGYYQHLGLETDVFEGLQDEIYDEYVEKYGEPTKYSRNRRVSEDAQKVITGQQMDLEQKLMQTAELLKAAEKENKKLQAQLTEAQRNMQVTKERRALESSVQKAADKLLKNYDVFPGDKRSYNEIKYEVASTLEKMRNIVLNVKDPEVYEQTLRRTAMTMTDRIISGMRRLKSTDSDSYNQIKQYLRAKPGITISETDKSSMRDYNAFRKRNMGRINLTNNGIPVDTAYKEMQELYGLGYFPDDITNPADQLYRMEEIMQTLEPVYENFNSYEIAEMKEYMASDLENEILDIVMGDAIKAVPPTEADKIVAQYESKIAGMEKSFNERLAEMQAKNKDKINKIVDNERNSRTESEQKIRDYYRELDAERRARRVDSDARTRLLKIARRLSSNKKLSTPNKALLQQYIGDLDLVAKSITRQTLDKLSDLKLWYDTEKATNPDFIPDPRTEAKLQRLSRWRISELSIQEVKDLTEVLLNIEHEDRTQRYLIEAADKRDIYIQGEEAIRDIQNSTGVKAGVLGKMDSLFVNGTLSPMRAMHRITGYNESDPLYRATKELSDGQRKMFDFQMRAGQMFTKWTEDRSFVREISGKNAKTIQIRPGVSITPDMRMSLYLHLKNDENLRHISSGGVTIPDMKLYRKGDIAEAYNRGKTIKLKKSEVEAIVQGMSEKERAFADQAAKYFGEMSQKEINETSELLKGYALAGVKNYFPINTDKNFTRSDFESLKMDGTIEGMGFLKERVQASNPIYLRDMSDVLKQSIEMTGKYVGLAIPVRNFNKIWNVATGEKNPEGRYVSFFDGSVKQEVSRKWGDPGLKYIENMMTDLQNGRKTKNDWSKVLGKVRSHYAQAVLTLNASVAMKQAASYPTAAAVLGWKPLVQALGDVRKVDENTTNKYTPLLWRRKQGYGTQELGDMKQQGMQLPPALNWVQGMDVATIKKLWKASEYYIRDNQKDLKIGSDEYYKAVADIFNRVVEETQPNYTTMQRPQLLRQDDTLLSSLMMFKTQPYQNFNILYDAIGNWRAKEQQYKQNTNAETEAAVKAARRDAANAITSQVAQLAVFAGMTFAWAMFRGKKDKYEDEDGEMTFGSAMKGIGKDMLGNAFSGIPFGADAWEYISSRIFGDKYYGFDVAVASSIEDLLNSFTKAGSAIGEVFSTITDKDKSLADINWNDQRMNMKSVVYAVAKIAGVPVENVEKFVSAAFRHVAKATAGKYEGEYAYLRLTTSENKYASDYYDLLWKAYKNDPEAYKKLYDQMESLDGMNADKIKSAMEKKMKAEEGVASVSDLSQRYMDPHTQETYDALLDPIDDSKLWSQASETAEGKLLNKLYNIAAETDSGTKIQQKMAEFEEAGIDNTTYLLYQLALDIADEQNDGNGSYTNPEKEAAIRMLNLSDQKSYDLWEAQSTAGSDKNNPWKK